MIPTPALDYPKTPLVQYKGSKSVGDDHDIPLIQWDRDSLRRRETLTTKRNGLDRAAFPSLGETWDADARDEIHRMKL